MAKTTSDSILGVIRKESWILDHFEIFVWRRSALSECFSSCSGYANAADRWRKNPDARIRPFYTVSIVDVRAYVAQGYA